MLHVLWISGLVALSAGVLMKLAPSASIRYTVATFGLAVCAVCPLLVSRSFSAPGALSVGAGDSGPVLAVWLVGVVIGACRLAADLVHVRRMTRQPSLDVPSRIWDSVRSIAARLGVRMPTRIVISASIAVPGVVGGIRYTLLLPLAMVNGLTPGECEAILAHELAHARRWDFAVNLLQRIVEIVWFFNPAVWWLSSRMRIEREFICDQIAAKTVGDGRLMAGALAALATTRRAPTLVATATGGSLFDRVQALAGARRFRLNLALPMATALVGWMLAVPSATRGPEQVTSEVETFSWTVKLDDPSDALIPIPMPAIDFRDDFAEDVTRLVDSELAKAFSEKRIVVRLVRGPEFRARRVRDLDDSETRTIEVWAVREP